MAHLAKYGRGAIGHMTDHYARSDTKSNVVRGNKSIKPELTHLNYNLAGELQPLNQMAYIRQRLSEVRVQKRSDVNLICDWVVTAPKSLPKSELEVFFQASYSFMAERYGQENVVSAYVHMDETTPHLHFAFLPIVKDRRRSGYKLSAKECINRSDLRTFHADLQKQLEKELGHPVEVLNEATQQGNRSIEELKRQTATERLQEANEKAAKIVFKAQTQAQGLNDSLIVVKAEYEAKKAYVRQADKVSDVSVMYPAEAKVTEKGLIHKQKFVTVPAEMWEAKHISANEKNYLQEATNELEKQIMAFRDTASARNILALTKRIEELERENSSLKIENRALESRISKVEREAEKTIAKINKVLCKLPGEAAEQFVKEWKASEGRSRDFDMGFER